MSPISSITGHSFQRDSLLKDLETGNVAHAYLFAGAPGLGKFTIATWFARTLLASDARDEEEARQVRDQASKLLHPELIVLDQLWIEEQCEDWDVIARSSNVPQQHRAKAHARTDTIGIEDIRAIHDRLMEIGTRRYRCCLIRSVERMQDEAVNALLKIVEEPPQGVVFLLTTQSYSSLLPTIISRSRVVRFNRLSTKELRPLLEGIEDEDARFLLHLAQGAPGMLIRLRDDPDQLRIERTVHGQAINFWQTRSVAERIKALAPIHERGPDADRFLLHLSLALREEIERRRPEDSAALHELFQGLETNVSRQLLAQRFAMAVRS